MSKFASARAKFAAQLTGVPPTPRSHSARANYVASLTGVPPQVGPHSARAKHAAAIKNPALDGKHVRNITRMYVKVDGQQTVTVTFAKTLIVNKGNAERRVDTVVTATVENVRNKSYEIDSQCQIICSERVGGRSSCPTNKSVRTGEVYVQDLAVLTGYLKTLTDYRDAQPLGRELGPSLPKAQATQQQKDLARATAEGMVPVGLSGVVTHSAMKAASRNLVHGRQALRWTAEKLTELAKAMQKTYPKGKGITEKTVLDKLSKGGGVLGVPASVDDAQAKWLNDYIDPGIDANNICVYSDMKLNGYDLYRKDVSPVWAKQGLRALYQFVFFVLDKNPLW